MTLEVSSLLLGSPDRAGLKWRRINLSVIILHYRLFSLTQASGHRPRLFMSESLSRVLMLRRQAGNQARCGDFLAVFSTGSLFVSQLYLSSPSNYSVPCSCRKTMLNTSLNTHLALLFLEKVRKFSLSTSNIEPVPILKTSGV